MEPQIRYVRSADGTNIAYWTLGEGRTPLVMSPPTGFGHLALEWQVPQARQWYERLSADRVIVRYDQRGTGLSQRNVARYGLDPYVQDLDAIVRQLGLGQHDLAVFDPHGVFAITYAVRFPGRLQRLVLAGVFSRPGEALRAPAYAAMLALSRTDWKLFTDSFAHAAIGWSGDAKFWSNFIRQSVSQDDFIRRYDALAEIDVTALLPQVAAPTLIVSQPGRFAVSEQWQEMASQIPGARLVQGMHPTAIPLAGPSLVRAIEEFLEVRAEEAHPVSREPAAPVAVGNAVILFIDIASSTALTERMGDAAFRTASRALDERLRAAIRDAGGTPVEGKVMGDGVMATFTSAREAIDAALRCNALSADSELRLHIGIHAGDVIREPDNVYGGAVNIASRICDASSPGEVLVSDVVRGMARTSADVTFEDRGEHALKGVADAQRVYAVRPID